MPWKDKNKKSQYDKQRRERQMKENLDLYREKTRESARQYYQRNKKKLCALQRKRRKENPDRFRKAEKKWRLLHAKQRKAIEKKWQQNNRKKLCRLSSIRQKKYPHRVQARLKASRHIKIPKDTLCSICRKNKATIRHHDDYTKPLDVLLVCNKCHYKIHNGADEL